MAREKDENGFFKIDCIVPEDASPGENHVIAWALRNDVYEASWTDPIIEIYSNTTLDLVMVGSIGVEDNLEIKGSLQDTSGMAVVGQTVNVYWNDSFIGTAETDVEGMFLFVAGFISWNVYS